MRFLALLTAALCLAAPLAHGAIQTPFVIASGSQAAGSADLNLTSTLACPTNTGVLVLAAGVGATNAPASVTDGGLNTYATVGLGTAGTLTTVRPLATQWTGAAPAGSGPAVGEPVGTVFDIHYAVTTQRQFGVVICAPGSNVPVVSSTDDIQGTGGSGTGTAINANPVAPSAGCSTCINELGFGFTVLTAGAGDSWTEQTGCTTLISILSTDAFRVAYCQQLGQPTPTYAPTNGASRVWASNYKPLRITPCRSASAGAGTC